jgi:putative membrane protein
VQRLKRIALAVLVMLLVFLVIIFILENRQLTSLFFLGWSSAQMPIAGVIISALLLGMVAGPLLAWLIGLRIGRRP